MKKKIVSCKKTKKIGIAVPFVDSPSGDTGIFVFDNMNFSGRFKQFKSVTQLRKEYSIITQLE
jgi:hypothetical protein